MKKITTKVGAFIGIAASVGIASQVFAYNPITSSLDFGQTSNNVTNLQTFFADNAAIYPEGKVTGYFGGLTKSAVMRFQAQYGFDQVGRVGPVTRDKINSIIANGGWTVSSNDVSGPAFYNVSKGLTSTSATFTFSTNENTMSKVVYSTSPLMFNEGDVNSNGFGAIGGLAVNSASGMAMSHVITLANLQPNTVYYYTVVSNDSLGNVSVLGPNNTFRTNQ
jgi:peptidoglycan hydrolase-like protein with peptidoglycan-binding domain